MGTNIKVQTCLWFDTGAEVAAEFYAGLIKNSKVTETIKQNGKPLTVTLNLAGHEVMLLNGGPMFKQTEAASIMAICDDNADADRLWKAFIENGGTESHCGWLKDRWNVSWQIVPAAFIKMASDKNPEKVARMMEAMMSMKQLDIVKLQKAFDGK
ncbi:VOC family protein [Oligoflexus tunisiensis]|uniref:VOC family protein n=1 Tax=Oligoflexus tunisiensis TaxID=708132 RepID=UPI00114CE199|nr:VOC family protein [Oligoflexus tunisiensis]